MFSHPPLTLEERAPEALFSLPPLTLDQLPEAVLLLPPLTEAYCAVTVLL